MSEQENDGYEVPFHRSLTEPILMAGCPRSLALLNGTLAAALGLGMHKIAILIVNVFLHFVFVALTKRDPQFFDVFRRHINLKKYYGIN